MDNQEKRIREASLPPYPMLPYEGENLRQYLEKHLFPVVGISQKKYGFKLFAHHIASMTHPPEIATELNRFSG